MGKFELLANLQGHNIPPRTKRSKTPKLSMKWALIIFVVLAFVAYFIHDAELLNKSKNPDGKGTTKSKAVGNPFKKTDAINIQNPDDAIVKIYATTDKAFIATHPFALEDSTELSFDNFIEYPKGTKFTFLGWGDRMLEKPKGRYCALSDGKQPVYTDEGYFKKQFQLVEQIQINIRKVKEEERQQPIGLKGSLQ